MRIRFVSLASLLLASACSGSNFEVPATDDGGTSDSATSDSVVAGDACAPPADPDTIYVDARATTPGTGTAACPLKTVREGLAAIAALPSGKRTLKIAGGTAAAPLVYDESTQLVVKGQTSVVGDGPERVTITGGGACGSFSCVMVLEGGASLEGVTVDAKIGNGLSLTPAAFTNVTVKNTVVTNAKGTMTAGARINGAGVVELGPAFRALKNEWQGVLVENVFSLRVVSGGSTPNAFNENTGGIGVIKGMLDFGGGEVAKNSEYGLYLASTPRHSVQNLDAHDNAVAAISLEPGAGLKLRNSKVVKNRVGLFVRFGLTVDIDLGTSVDAGKNVLGGADDKNERAAICFQQSRETRINAQANKWSACPPTVAPIPPGGGCDSLSSYQDVYYTAATTGTDPGAPIEFGSCSVGP